MCTRCLESRKGFGHRFSLDDVFVCCLRTPTKGMCKFHTTCTENGYFVPLKTFALSTAGQVSATRGFLVVGRRFVVCWWGMTVLIDRGEQRDVRFWII